MTRYIFLKIRWSIEQKYPNNNRKKVVTLQKLIKSCRKRCFSIIRIGPFVSNSSFRQFRHYKIVLSFSNFQIIPIAVCYNIINTRSSVCLFNFYIQNVTSPPLIQPCQSCPIDFKHCMMIPDSYMKCRQPINSLIMSVCPFKHDDF